MREENVLQAPEVGRPWPLTERGTTWSAWVECQRMLITFASHRLEKDAAVMLRWGACRHWQDFFDVQESWAKDALHDYGTHVRELLGLMAPDDIHYQPPRIISRDSDLPQATSLHYQPPRIISRDSDLPQATSPFAS